MSQQAKRYRPTTRQAMRVELSAREYAREVNRYLRKGV